MQLAAMQISKIHKMEKKHMTKTPWYWRGPHIIKQKMYCCNSEVVIRKIHGTKQLLRMTKDTLANLMSGKLIEFERGKETRFAMFNNDKCMWVEDDFILNWLKDVETFTSTETTTMKHVDLDVPNIEEEKDGIVEVI